MARRLNLTRNQLASFCKDFEQVRQFELLFAAVNSLLDSANDGANLAPPVVENVIVQSGGGDGDLAPPVADSITYIQNIINAPDLLAPEEKENNSVKTDYIDLDRKAPVVSTPGRLWWDEDEKTAVLALSGGNVTLHLGQEELQDCYNGTGATLAKGTVVQVTGAQGNRLRIAKAQANTEATSNHTFGFVDESIANGAEGFVQNSGLIRGLNTTVDSEGHALTAGQTLYLSSTVAGGYTNVKPVAPDNLVVVGFVVRVSATVGSIFVKVDNGYEIEELHNVKVTAPVLAGSLLIYDDTLDVWKNARLTAGTGVTITNGDASITIASHVPVTLNANVTDVLSLTTQEIGAVDAGADRILFWDDSANKTTYLAPSAPIQITGINLEHATSGVAAATYGSATQVAQVTVDTFGHVTSASNVTISGVTPSAHASTHQHGGSDEVATATAAANAIPKAGAAGQLAAGWMPSFGGDVSTSAGSTVTTITSNAVTLGKIQTIGTDRLLGRDSAGGGNVEQLTVSGGIEFTDLGGIQTSALTGDVTKAAGGTSTTIANDAVTYAKIQNVGANSVLARAAATAGDVGEVPLTASQLLGRGSTGDVAAITLGTNLSMSGTTLNATGGGSVTIGVSAADVLSATGSQINGVDAGTADRIVFWDDSAGKLTYLAPTAPIQITTTNLELDATLTALASYNTNGLITQTAADTFTGRSVAGTTNQISVTNGDGVSGNPTVALSSTIVAPGTLQLAQNSLLLRDTDNTHNLIVNAGSNLTLDRTLTISTGDASRTLTMNGNATISGTNTGDQTIPNNFGTIAVAGQTNVVADVDSDTLTLAATNMVAITTTPATDTVTINVPLLTGDVTTTSAGAATIANLAVTTAKIADNAVTFTKFQEVTGPAFIGRNTALLGPVTDMNATTATSLLNTFTSTLKGLAPSSGGGTTNYLRADGTWNAPPGVGGLLNIATYTLAVTSQTHTFNTLTNFVIIEAIGGGGGGGGAAGAASSAGAGSGGGGGGYAWFYGQKTAANCTYNVGSGGAGGIANTTAPIAGNLSSVVMNGVTVVDAKGGAAGSNSPAGTALAATAPGAGGTAAAGTVISSGQPGQAGIRLSGNPAVAISGSGGNSQIAGGGISRITSSAGQGGSNPGGGGSGACTTNATPQNGGSGGVGMVRIWEFD